MVRKNKLKNIFKPFSKLTISIYILPSSAYRSFLLDIGLSNCTILGSILDFLRPALARIWTWYILCPCTRQAYTCFTDSKNSQTQSINLWIIESVVSCGIWLWLGAVECPPHSTGVCSNRQTNCAWNSWSSFGIVL